MTILQKLDRLDKAFGFWRPFSEEKFRRTLRIWWMYPLMSVVYLFMAMFFLGRTGVPWWQWIMLMAFGPSLILYSFIGGFWYREHLRQEGKRSWFMKYWPASGQNDRSTVDRET